MTNDLLCYCFKYSKEDFLKAVKEGREEVLIQEIKSKMKDPGCFCESANPSGNCCMGDIKKFVKENGG